MPSYRIRKDSKAGLLVSPNEVTVISTVEELSSDTPPADHPTVQLSEQTAPVLQPSAQVSAQAPAASTSTSMDVFFLFLAKKGMPKGRRTKRGREHVRLHAQHTGREAVQPPGK